MVKEGGQYFCSPISAPSLQFASEGYEYSIAISATLEDAHTVILVRAFDGHSNFLGRKTCPRIYLETGVSNFFSPECHLQNYILESLTGHYGLEYLKKEDKERREVFEEKGRREKKMREKPAVPVTWNKHVFPASTTSATLKDTRKCHCFCFYCFHKLWPGRSPEVQDLTTSLRRSLIFFSPSQRNLN